MSSVQFEEDNSYNQNSFSSSNQGPKGLTKLVIKFGFAKDEKQAQYVLLGVAVLMIAVSLFLVFGGGRLNATPVSKEVIDKALNQTNNLGN